MHGGTRNEYSDSFHSLKCQEETDCSLTKAASEIDSLRSKHSILRRKLLSAKSAPILNEAEANFILLKTMTTVFNKRQPMNLNESGVWMDPRLKVECGPKTMPGDWR